MLQFEGGLQIVTRPLLSSVELRWITSYLLISSQIVIAH